MLSLQLGFWGLCLGIVATLVLIVLILLKLEVHRLALLGLCVWFSVSALLFLVPQTEVISKFSSGSGSDDSP
ncbi:hypothetical protein BH11ARM2_BH11ARM2_36510 [soil metagenome]